MIVVGGLIGYATATDGAAYDPNTGRWRIIATRPNPDHVVRLGAWTGTELVVFGVPRSNLGGPATSGAAYDPATDTWRTIAALPAEISTGQVMPMMAGWTGRQVVVYGIGRGEPGKASVARAGLYDPKKDSWTVLPPIEDATAVGRAGMAGDRFAVLGLSRGPSGPEPRLFVLDTGGGRWHESPVAPVAIPSYPQVPPVWNGRELVVSSSDASYPDVPSVAYDPATDRWRTVDAPIIADLPNGQHGEPLADGRFVAEVQNPNGPAAVYDPGRDCWAGTGAAPGGQPGGPVMVSTGHEVLFWGIDPKDPNAGYNHPDTPGIAWAWTPSS